MGKIKSFNGKFINYLVNEKINEEFVEETVTPKYAKRMTYPLCKREIDNNVSPGSDMKQNPRPVKYNRHTQSSWHMKYKNGYEHKASNLRYSFTADMNDEDETLIENENIISNDDLDFDTTTNAMNALVKKNKPSKNFFSSLTKKLLSNKRSTSMNKRTSLIIPCTVGSAKNSKTKSIKNKYLNTKISYNNIPMQVIETLYTISFTKHSYYIQRSLRRSTMIVNLITEFRNTYEELREIDTPKLKRRISFKERVPIQKLINRAEQPKEGSLLKLREEREAKYYQVFGDKKPFSIPKRKKRLPKKPLLDFSDCETLPIIPATAAGAKINHFITNCNETERKKLKPIKSIDKELCLIFNKEYIPEEQMGKEEDEEDDEEIELEEENEEDYCIIEDDSEDEEDEEDEEEEDEEEEDDDSTDNIAIGKIMHFDHNNNVVLSKKQQHLYNNYYNSNTTANNHAIPVYSKHSSINFNNLPITPIPQFTPLPRTMSYEDDFSIDSKIPYIEEGDEEKENLSSVYNDINKKESKRISGGTLYDEPLDEGNTSSDSDNSDITLKEDDSPKDIYLSSNDSSFIIVDEGIHNINFNVDEEENESRKEEQNIEGKSKKEENKKAPKDSFSNTKSYILMDEKENNNKNVANFSSFTSEEEDFFNNSMSILNNSIINESFTLTLNDYEDDKNKPLNRIDSGVDLNCMNNINYLMERKCQI